MADVNHLMHRIDHWQQAVHPETKEIQGCLLRYFRPRAANLFMVAPQELYFAVENILLAIVQVPAGALRASLSLVCYIATSAHPIQRLRDSLYSVSDCMKTLRRVAAYALGTFSSAIIGALISPKLNFRIHSSLGLVVPLKDVEIMAAPAEIADFSIFSAKEEAVTTLEVLHTNIDPISKMMLAFN